MKKILIPILCLLAAGCAKIPVQSVTLMQQIQQEGERMHRLNVAYVNKTFNDKLNAVNEFMQNEYIPDLMKGIKAKIAKDSINMNNEWEKLFAKLNPVINSVKDSLTRALEQNRSRIITKLNEDYLVYQQACETQLNFLNSAVKVNQASKNAADAVIKKFSGNKIDLATLEQVLDKYLKKGESAASMVLNLYNDINTNILKNI